VGEVQFILVVVLLTLLLSFCSVAIRDEVMRPHTTGPEWKRLNSGTYEFTGQNVSIVIHDFVLTWRRSLDIAHFAFGPPFNSSVPESFFDSETPHNPLSRFRFEIQTTCKSEFLDFQDVHIKLSSGEMILPSTVEVLKPQNLCRGANDQVFPDGPVICELTFDLFESRGSELYVDLGQIRIDKKKINLSPVLYTRHLTVCSFL
jgi:hypothetical protein